MAGGVWAGPRGGGCGWRSVGGAVGGGSGWMGCGRGLGGGSGWRGRGLGGAALRAGLTPGRPRPPWSPQIPLEGDVHQ